MHCAIKHDDDWSVSLPCRSGGLLSFEAEIHLPSTSHAQVTLEMSILHDSEYLFYVTALSLWTVSNSFNTLPCSLPFLAIFLHHLPKHSPNQLFFLIATSCLILLCR
jgi:hypothetical protein